LFLFAAALVATQASSARAQQAPAAPDASRDREARGLFEAGGEAFTAGRYADALDYFQRAYALSGRAVLLYNIGVAADRLRRDDEAITAFERYLSDAPATITNRTEVEGRLRALEEIRAQRVAATTTTTTATATPVEPTTSTEPTPETTPTPPVSTDPVPSDEHGGGGRLFTWIALGAAVAAGTGGAIIGALASSDYDTLVKDCAARGGCTPAEVSDATLDSRALLANILFAVGGAALVTGAVLFFVEGGGDSPEDAQVAAGVSLGGVVVRGRF
jgi:tetratricopeptide (TPR) repeat protein